MVSFSFYSSWCYIYFELSIICLYVCLVFNLVLIQHCLIIFSITSRVCTTLRGSSDDIGWLQCTPGMASVEDGTARFLELLAGIRYHAKSVSSYPTIVGPAPAPERGRERTCVGYDSSMHFISGILLITMDSIFFWSIFLFSFIGDVSV